MKRLLGLISLLIVVTSCNSQVQNFGLNLSIGQSYSHDIVSNSTITQDIYGRSVKVDVTTSYKMIFKVLDYENLIYNLEVRYDRISMKIDRSNQIIEVNSENNDESDTFSKIIRLMKNGRFFIKMKRNGEIVEMENLENIYTSVIDSFPNISEQQKLAFKTQMEQSYGVKTIKDYIEMVTSIFPDSTVTKSDKWIKKSKSEIMFASNMQTTYELKDITNQHYIISGISESKSNDDYIEYDDMDIKYNMKGKMLSEIKINKESGWAYSAEFNQEIEGEVEAKDSPEVPGGLIIPMTINIKMTINKKPLTNK